MNFFKRICRRKNLEIWTINDSDNFKNLTTVFLWEDDLNICTLIISTFSKQTILSDDSVLAIQIDSLTSDLVNSKSQKFFFEQIYIDESKLVDNHEDSIKTQMISFYNHEEWNLVRSIAEKYSIIIPDLINDNKNFKC